MLKKLEVMKNKIQEKLNNKGEGYLSMILAIAIMALIISATAPTLRTEVGTQITNCYENIKNISL